MNNFRHIPYVVISGNKVLGHGIDLTTSIDEIAQRHTPHTVKEVSKDSVTVPLPAYWDPTVGIVPLPTAPSINHVFDYDTLTWVPDMGTAWRRFRKERDRLLALTDWRSTRAVEENRKLHPQWIAYRQALRDITTTGDPLNPDWPELPDAPTFADEDLNTYPIFVGNAKFELFTVEEQAAILQAAQHRADLMLLVNRLSGAAYISYEDSEMELGLSLLVQASLLTQERKDAIVQLMLPPALRG